MCHGAPATSAPVDLPAPGRTVRPPRRAGHDLGERSRAGERLTARPLTGRVGPGHDQAGGGLPRWAERYARHEPSSAGRGGAPLGRLGQPEARRR